MALIQRSEKFQFRMTGEERRMLEALAEREGLSASDKLRQLIRKEHATAFGEAPPKRRKR
ncbi:hypothetical protein Rctr16k_06 [Virus Rctr16k]|nr:hypothetical protein Rctr16k_06 [Virus Rctr16k]